MTAPVPRQDIAERLSQAIDQLHQDVQRIEIWAGALTGFTCSVPEYRPDDGFLLGAGASQRPEGTPPSGPKGGADA